MNTAKGFASKAILELSNRLDIDFVETPNHFAEQGSKDALVELSGCLKTLAVGLMKIANDIRWLASGPRCGIGEIILSGNTTGFFDYAGEGKSGDCRVGDDGLCAGDWK